MNLTVPAGLSGVANNILNQDLEAGNAQIYMGVYQRGDTIRLWGGIDANKTDGKGNLT